MLHTTIPAKEIINGNVPVLLNFDINYNDAGINAGVRKYTLTASEDRPVYVEVQAEVITAFNSANTNVLTLGTSLPAANQWLSSGNITEGTPGFYPASNAVFKARLTADTNIYARYSSGVAQVNTATIVIAVPGTNGAGTVAWTFTSALTGVLTGTATILVNTTATLIAAAVAAALNANTTFAAYFSAAGSVADVVITALYTAANDATMNLAYTNGTATGLTPDATSTATTAGVAGDATTGKAKFYIKTTPLYVMT